MKKIVFILSIALTYQISIAQITSVVRGTVVDMHSETPIPGINIILLDTDPVIGATTDFAGNFILENVLVGRVSIQFTAIGYKPIVMKSLLLKSSKELVLNVKLEEDIQLLDEVVIKAGEGKERPINKMATVSARSFTIEETEKYAGSLGDPSRMVQNYAGVFSAGDNRNDIIIRGNSPSGLLWRLDGINIPNPNHFGALGSTGGPVSMLNNNLLANSDFFTSAWPAEFGNSLSGVFDLNMRCGNNQSREYVFQVGFNGFELGAEGPFRKNHQSSYLINYRYSTLDVMDKLGFNVASGAVPRYQDLSFKVNMPTKKAGKFSLTGIMGMSNIFFDHRNQNEGQYSNYSGADTKNGSDMITLNLKHVFFLNEKSRFESFANFSGFRVSTSIQNYNYVQIFDSLNLSTGDSVFHSFLQNDYLFFHENNSQLNYSAGTKFRSKINSKSYLDFGITASFYSINYIDSVFVNDYNGWPVNSYIRQTDISKSGIPFLEAYGQWNYKFTGNISMFSGIHYQHLLSNGSIAIEPRWSLKWQFAEKQSLSLGYGLHSQMQPLFIYYSQTPIANSYGEYFQNNKDLGFSKAHHGVIAYDWIPIEDFRVKIEAYYQYLYNIPVEMNPSAISIINYGASFHQSRIDSLVNDGNGYNYGTEITLEKFFSNNFYFLATASLFQSKFTTKQDIWRNTAFNNNFVFNLLGGYEFKLSKNGLLSIDVRTVYAGGIRYLSIIADESGDNISYDYDNAYEKRSRPYFRTDLRLSYKTNMKRVTHEWGIDFQNVSNHKNLYAVSYDSNTKESYETYQTGFYPMFLYRFNF
jgi:hypothetical protein